MGTNSTGATQNFAGDSFNLSPRWFGNFDVLYRRPVSSGLDALIGAGTTSRSKTVGVVGGNDPAFDIKAYTLLDAEVGIEQHDGKWNVKLWGKNLTNKYYWNNTSYTADVITKLAGMPVTYGISAGYRF